MSNSLLKRIEDELRQWPMTSTLSKTLHDCKAELVLMAQVNEGLRNQNLHLDEALAALEAKGEPVCYITQAALDALKRGASSSVRVWLNPDEPNGDVALYTKESL